MEAEGSGLELLVTIVVAAADDQAARAACEGFVRRVGGRVAGSGDCSDEEPGCWSVTVSRAGGEVAVPSGSAELSRQVRGFLRELGSAYAEARVSCEPPTAWTVLDDPELVDALVPGGERMLVEAWLDGSLAPAAPTGSPQHAAEPATERAETEVDGGALARLGLVVDVVTERAAGAEWPARALASRLSRQVAITSRSEHPPIVRVRMDLGDTASSPSEAVAAAATELGGTGWTRPSTDGAETMVRWAAAPTPDSGIAAVVLVATTQRPVTAETPSQAG